jgi:hypothetical protein
MIFRTYYQSLCNYAFTFVRDKDKAEEIVQGTFLSLWEKRGHYSDPYTTEILYDPGSHSRAEPGCPETAIALGKQFFNRVKIPIIRAGVN